MSESANELGNRLRGEGKFDEAHRAYVAAIEEDENNTHAWCNIGLLFAMKNENEKAEKCFRTALEIDPDDRPGDATREIDAHGAYVMPGIVDTHTHTGGSTKAPEAEYTYKLWLGHGITTVRGVPSGRMEFSLSEKERSANNEITAPRIFSYHRMGSGERYEEKTIRTPDQAREWVRYAAKAGIDGLKLGA